MLSIIITRIYGWTRGGFSGGGGWVKWERAPEIEFTLGTLHPPLPTFTQTALRFKWILIINLDENAIIDQGKFIKN